MSFRTTLILGVIAALMGAYIYIVEIKGKQKKVEAEETARLIFDIGENPKFDSITLRKATEEVRLVHSETDEGWKIVYPIKYPADQTAAEAIINEIRGLKSNSEIKETADLKEFGLASPEITLSARYGSKEINLAIGDENPIDSSLYVRTGDGKVYTVDSYTKIYFAKNLFDLRDKEVLKIKNDSDVKKLIISTKGSSVTLEAETGEILSDWEITSPVKVDADDEKVSDMVRELRYMRALSFHPVSQSKALGFEEPVATVEIFLGNEFAKIEALLSKKGDKAYVMIQSTLDIMEIGPGTIDNLSANANELTERRVSRFDRFEAEAIKVTSKEHGEFELKRKEDGSWEFTAPAKELALDSAVSDFLSSMENLEARDLPTISAKAAGIGRIKYSIIGEDGKILAEVEVGNTLDDKGIYVKNSKKTQVFLVPVGTKFPSRVDDFKTSQEPPLSPPEEDPIESPIP